MRSEVSIQLDGINIFSSVILHIRTIDGNSETIQFPSLHLIRPKKLRPMFLFFELTKLTLDIYYLLVMW